MPDNICMIVLSDYPFDPRVRRQAEVLEKAGYNIDIICLRGESQEKVEKMGFVTVYRIMKAADKESMAKYMLLSLSFFLLSLIKLQELSFRNSYKLIQVHNMPDFLVFSGFIQKLMGKRLVLDIHDLTVELFETRWPEKKKSLLMKFVRLVEKMSCGFADHVITVTDACKMRLMERGVPDKKITLVLNTADPEIFRFDDKRSFKKIDSYAKLIYHGTVAERFGIHTAIEAVALLQKEIPGSTLHIYGKYDPAYRKRLEKLITDLGVEQYVTLNGTRSLEEIYEIIKNSDMGLVPYVNDPYMNIALSTKTFEYAAAGLPVVASHLYSLSLVFDDQSLKFVRAEDASGFAAAIAEMCLNPELRCRNSRNASDIVKSISGDVMGRRYLELIKQNIYSKAVIQ
ncbi:MAG: glycosyltransferase family 4 protein [Ignavibacteriales bacterium]